MASPAVNGQIREQVMADALALAGADPRRERALLDSIAEALAEDVGDACCISLLHEGRLNPVALGHRNAAARRLLTELVRLPLGMSAIPAATIVMVTQKPMRAEVAPMPVMLSMFPRLAPYVKRYPIESMLSLPLRGDPTAVGAMGFVRHERGRPYTREDEEALMQIADAIADALSSNRVS